MGPLYLYPLYPAWQNGNSLTYFYASKSGTKGILTTKTGGTTTSIPDVDLSPLVKITDGDEWAATNTQASFRLN